MCVTACNKCCRQSTGLGYTEATFYLGNGKSYEEALAEAQEDIKWEKEQKASKIGVMEEAEAQEDIKWEKEQKASKIGVMEVDVVNKN